MDTFRIRSNRLSIKVKSILKRSPAPTRDFTDYSTPGFSTDASSASHSNNSDSDDIYHSNTYFSSISSATSHDVELDLIDSDPFACTAPSPSVRSRANSTSYFSQPYASDSPSSASSSHLPTPIDIVPRERCNSTPTIPSTVSCPVLGDRRDSTHSTASVSQSRSRPVLPTFFSSPARRFPLEPWNMKRDSGCTIKPGQDPIFVQAPAHSHASEDQTNDPFRHTPSWISPMLSPSRYGGRYGRGTGSGDDGSEDEYHHRPVRGARSPHVEYPSRVDQGNTSSADSDEVPLAKRFTNALNAQKSLRKQARDEKEERKRAQSLPRASAARQAWNVVTTGKSQAKSTGLDAAKSTEASGIISADELNKRLLHLQTSNLASSSKRSPEPLSLGAGPSPRHAPRHHPTDLSAPSSPKTHGPAKFSFPSSFVSQPRQPQKQKTFDANHVIPHDEHQRQVSRAKTTANAHSRRTSAEFPSIPPPRKRVDTLVSPADLSSKPPQPRQRANTLHSTSAPQPSFAASRPSMSTSTGRTSLSSNHPAHNAGLDGMHIRVFVGDMQTFSHVTLTSEMKARDVISAVQENGDLPTNDGTGRPGRWVLFEMANDYGMERPIRDFEPVMEIYSSWNSDTRLNVFLLKWTMLGNVLTVENIPSSTPVHAGYVEWEQRRGRWAKRWLHLHDNTLWLSKKEGAKDAVQLCNLSNFDAYLVTRLHKGPKPFIFAVKSVSNLRLFEREADYNHVFSCSESDGPTWLERVLVARSYVLRQERNTLFHGTINPHRAPSIKSRAGPFLQFDATSNVVPPVPAIPSQLAMSDANTFEPGSLLAKRVGS